MAKDNPRHTIYGKSRADFDPLSPPSIGQQQAYAVTENQTFPVTMIASNGSVVNVNWDVTDISTDNKNTFNLDGLITVSLGYAINPAGAIDRWRNNGEQLIYGATPRTATNNTSDFTNYNWKGLQVVFDVRTPASGFTITPVIQGKDNTFDVYYDILRGNAITASGTTVLKVYPGIGQISGAASSDILPRIWRFRVEHGDATSVTYTGIGNLVV